MKEPRPKTVKSRTRRVHTQCGNIYVTVSHKDHKIFEVFAVLGKSGGCVRSLLEALTLSITMGIRHGVPPEVYINKLKGASCPVKSIDDGVTYTSCSDIIAKVMEEENEQLKRDSE